MSDAAFDSNILIDSLNGLQIARDELRRVSRRWISRVAWIEVMTGVDPASLPMVTMFFRDFTIVELDEAIARRTAAIRSERKRLKLADAIILATAQAHGHVLVTRNTKDFPPELPGIRVPYQL